MDLPTPDDTSRAEDRPDASREGGPSFFDLGCLSNLAVLLGVFLCGCIFGCRQINLGWTVGHGGGLGGPPIPPPTAFEGGENAVVWLSVLVYVLPILPIVVWIAGAVAYKAYKNRPFMDVGPKTLSLLLILSVTAIIITLDRFSFSGGEFGGFFDVLALLILVALVILYLVSLVYRFVVWITPAAADNAKYYASAQRGAGSGRFFLDEDE